jgi:hypothetical protein
MDRIFWTALRQCWSRWSEVLIIVKRETVVGWPRTLAFEHGELLKQRQELAGGITPGLKEHAECGKAGEDRFDEHEAILLT